MNFCHISPTKYLDIFASGRKFHLLLAHLVEEDSAYCEWYKKEKERTNCVLILDNSAFEMYKRKQPMYDSKKLIQMAKKVNADYVVMTDFPNDDGCVTIQKAMDMAPELKNAGFKTFFCPQSKIGNKKDLVDCFNWAADSDLVDYIGFSILAIPNAYGVEKSNNLQRFMSRWRFMYELQAINFFHRAFRNNKKLHLLGMLDGPNEIFILKDFMKFFHTWDSSAAVWTGLNNIAFDDSPTGLINGKFEEEVDFSHKSATIEQIGLAMKNLKYIDNLLDKAYNESNTAGL